MPQDASAALSSEDDLAQPFMLESSGIRGDLVRLGSVADHIITRHAYPDPLASMLGEVLALTAMLSSMMKYDGVFTLQTKSDGPVRMMVADMTTDGHLRGYAGFDGAKLKASLGRHARARHRARYGASPGVPQLLGEGHLAFTVDQGPHTERYQGIVKLTGPTLAYCLQHYFGQSEQIQTGLIVAAHRRRDAWHAAGLILQRVPGESAGLDARTALPDEDAWRRAMVLQASCTEAELLDPELPVNDLLYRLFHEEGVRVFRRRPLTARCRCSRERLEETLRAMPRAEIEELRIDGAAVVTCEFCNRCYRFDGDALDRFCAP